MSKSKIATLGIVFVTFIWGTEFVLIHNAIALLEPNSFNAVRFGTASLFIGICLLLWKKRGGFNWSMVWHGSLLGLLLCLGFSLQTFGLLYTSVSNCAFITSLSVLLVPLAAYLLLGDRPRYLTVVGACVAAVGLYILTTSGDTRFNLGDILTLICAIMFALHMVYTGKYSRQYEVLPLTLIQLVTVSILSLIGAFIFEDWQRLLDIKVIGSSNVLLAVGIAAILGTALAILIQTLAQGHLSSTRVALIFSLEPVFAALTAYLVLNEQLPATAGLGAGMILGGILLAEFHFQESKDMVPAVGEQKY
jgi:drug/metabolite transporter (DMT)-like permease